VLLKRLWPGAGGTSHSGVRLMTRGIVRQECVFVMSPCCGIEEHSVDIKVVGRGRAAARTRNFR
jgi:hypothetical protein